MPACCGIASAAVSSADKRQCLPPRYPRREIAPGTLSARSTAAQTQTVYEACGLRAEGGTYTLIFFSQWSADSMTDSSDDWDYSTVKTAIDSNLGDLSSDANTRLGTYITKYDDTATSSIRLQGEVRYDAAEEQRLARNRIVNIVGVEVEEIDRVAEARREGRQGEVGR